MKTFNLVNLFGGRSDESRVSVASAQSIAEVLSSAKLWFWGRDGKIFEVTPSELARHLRPFETEFIPSSPAIYPSVEAALGHRENKTKVFVLSVHGGEGEDGTLQSMLERHRLAFTGSGSASSARAFDKRAAKAVAKKSGVRTCDEIEIRAKELSAAREALTTFFHLHRDVMVKPVAGGSSIGLFRVRNEEELKHTLGELEKTGDLPYLAEPFVKGREITVGVYDDGGDTLALPPSEVRTSDGKNFDYEGKYLGRGSIEITPAEISAELTSECQRIAVTVHRALGCEGYSRTDLILGETGPVYLETNTLPGLTKASFIPQQLAAAKIPFAKFLDAQIALAVRRRDGG